MKMKILFLSVIEVFLIYFYFWCFYLTVPNYFFWMSVNIFSQCYLVDVTLRRRHLSSALCLLVKLVLMDSVNEVYVLETS